MLILYTTDLSANGRKALALARHLGVEHEVRMVNVYQGEGQSETYKAVNPWGKIPTLLDGDFLLWESNAILVYLAEREGAIRVFPQDPRGRAHILRWLFWESSHFQPVLSRALAPRVGQVLFRTEGPDVNVDWTDKELALQLAYIEGELASHDYIAGDALSIADFSIAGMTTYFRAAGFPEQTYPAISAWMGRMMANPAWASTLVAPWA